MDTETALDGDLDPEKLKTLLPLSLFFPEVTEEEAQILDSETARIMERRMRVMDLYRAGKSMLIDDSFPSHWRQLLLLFGHPPLGTGHDVVSVAAFARRLLACSAR